MTNSTVLMKVLSGGLLATKSMSIACGLRVLREGKQFLQFHDTENPRQKKTCLA